MNEKDNFIVEDLDDFHVIIKADEEYRVRKQLDMEVRRCSKSPLFFRVVALTVLSVGEEYVQFRMMCITQQYDEQSACGATNPASFAYPRIPVTFSLSSEGT